MKSSFKTTSGNGISYAKTENVFVEIDMLFHNILKNVNSSKMYVNNLWELLHKRKSVNTNEEYLFLLGDQLTFYQNMLDLTLVQIKELVDNDSTEFEVERFASEMRTIIDKINKYIENGGAKKITELHRSKHESDEDVTYMKEQQFIFIRIKYDVMVEWLGLFVESKDLHKSVKKVKGKLVKESVQERLDYYTKRVIEKAAYGE